MTDKVVETSRQRELGQLDGDAALQGGLVGEDADAGPVGGEGRVRPRIAVVAQGTHHFVDEVWVRAAVAAALNE